MKRWEEIRFALKDLEQQTKVLRDELSNLQEHCTHPQLPRHTLTEEYRDTCPDCGFFAYCYRLG